HLKGSRSRQGARRSNAGGGHDPEGSLASPLRTQGGRDPVRASHPDLDTIRAALQPHGLFLRGTLNFAAGEAAPALDDGRPAAGVVLVGNISSSIWPAFSRWRAEQADRGGKDPLDAWSKTVIRAVAAAAGVTAWFPS